MRLIAAGLLATALFLLTSCDERPYVLNDPTAINAAGFDSTGIRIDGWGFGEAKVGRQVKFRSGRKWYRVRSVSKRVVHWDDNLIILRYPRTLVVDEAYVRTEKGESNRRSVETYAYDWFDVPPGLFHPSQIAHDGAGRVWIHSEFQENFHVLDPSDGVVEQVDIPFGPSAYPFAFKVDGVWYSTRLSAGGEDITVDDAGVVYFSQSGYTYDTPIPNHSRIIRHDPNAPAGEQTRVYNVPGDENHVWGVEWDAARHRLWFVSHRNQYGPAKLTSFDPDAVPWDNEFDFSTSLDHQICAPGEPDGACYKEYPLPARVFMTAHVAIDHDGFVWYTGYWGSGTVQEGRTEIGRLDPESGEVRSFPVSNSAGSANPNVGAGPWDIEVAPNGDIVYTEFFDAHLARFDMSRVDDPACQRLDAALRNPCIVELVPSGDDTTSHRAHSIDHDAAGNMWFGHQDGERYNFDSLGYVTPNWEQIVRLPPMGPYTPSAKFLAAGVTINRSTGEIWFSESQANRRIGRVRRVN